MILSFNIEYRTNWGEEVRLAGLSTESVPMHTTDGIYWTAELEVEVPQEGLTINYNYQIEQNGSVIRKEWDNFPRCIFLSGVPKKKYMIAGKTFRSNCTFIVRLLRKRYCRIPKGKVFRKVTRRD